MSYKPFNQKGFAAMEAVLVIIILAIVAGTGYYVYRANKNTTDTQNASHQAAESAAVSTSATKSAVTAGAQAKKIYTNLLQAYNKNGKAHSDWDVTYVNSQSASTEFTKDFKAAVKNGTAWSSQGVFCTSNYTFEGFLVKQFSLKDNTATVVLSQTVKGQPSSTDYPNASS